MAASLTVFYRASAGSSRALCAPLRRFERPMPSAGLPLVQALTRTHQANGPGENAQIERQRLVLDIPEVEFDPLGPRQRRTAIDLRPPRDAGLDPQAPELALRVLADLHRNGRSRTDDRHLSADHVPEVGHLIQRVAPQPPADAGYALIALLNRKPGAYELRAADHRPQLVDRELAFVLADAGLCIDRIAPALDSDGQRREADHGGRQQRTRNGDQ